MNSLVTAASKNGPMSIVANLALVFIAIFVAISALACGLYLGGLFAEELSWHIAVAALAWIIFAVSCHAFLMFREYSRFKRLFREHQHLFPVRAEVIGSWSADQTGFDALSFSKGIIHFDDTRCDFTTSDEWAFKRIMKMCGEVNPSFIKTKIPEPTFSI